ncbi:AAA family ATPase [Synechococcales cyanobacterium C]|uniref:Gluconokinase n=1 Tax=Petrachloros mirabilis ULC683 TaxID=2781853 RepID=A0A8K1ZZK8_9CYAN|nr:gluconokinase, GntK/IdnK-type [Petrachloros mirabilis]NCJ08220.1 AAA family ATPase [Petrachloros mirabilis ULC683]
MIIIVMGVSGSGKTTLGKQLALCLNWEFQDADGFHAPAQIAKMRQGIPLTDADRAPWLQRLRVSIEQWQAAQCSVVLACSALKARYRHQIDPNEQCQWVYLQGSFELFQHRLAQRLDHYMPASLLQSQFESLEEPQNAIVVGAALPIAVLVQQVKAQLDLDIPAISLEENSLES